MLHILELYVVIKTKKSINILQDRLLAISFEPKFDTKLDLGA